MCPAGTSLLGLLCYGWCPGPVSVSCLGQNLRPYCQPPWYWLHPLPAFYRVDSSHSQTRLYLAPSLDIMFWNTSSSARAPVSENVREYPRWRPPPRSRWIHGGWHLCVSMVKDTSHLLPFQEGPIGYYHHQQGSWLWPDYISTRFYFNVYSQLLMQSKPCTEQVRAEAENKKNFHKWLLFSLIRSPFT